MKNTKANKLWTAVVTLLLIVHFTSCHPRQQVITRIEHDLSGCFGSQYSILSIYKIQDTIYARLETDGKLSKESTIASAQLDTITSFVKTLNTRDFTGGCTTVEKYSVFSEGKYFEKEDGSCDWEGFSKLTSSLFN